MRFSFRMQQVLDRCSGDRPRKLAAERNIATRRALLGKLPADGKSRCAAGLTRRRTIPSCARAMARAGLHRVATMLAVSSRRTMQAIHACCGAGLAACFHRRGTLRGTRVANRKGCEKNAEDCLTVHEGECEQSRAPLVYVDLYVGQSVFRDARSSDNWMPP